MSLGLHLFDYVVEYNNPSFSLFFNKKNNYDGAEHLKTNTICYGLWPFLVNKTNWTSLPLLQSTLEVL